MKSGAAEGQTGYSGACMSAGEGGGIPVQHGEILVHAEASLRALIRRCKCDALKMVIY